MIVIEYIKPFISLVFLVTIHVFLGKLILQKSSSFVINFFAGYSLIYIGFITSTFVSNKVIFIFLILIILLLLSYIYLKNKNKNFFINTKSLIFCQILILPLYIYSLNLPQLNWDDYATWLPNAFFIYENFALPNRDNLNSLSAVPSYPYGFPIIISVLNIINFNFVENLAPFLNIFIFSTFFLILKNEENFQIKSIFFSLVKLLPLLIFSILIINSKGVFSAGPDLLLCILCLLYVRNSYVEDKLINSSLKLNFFNNHLLEQIFISIAIVATKQVGIYILIILNSGIFLTNNILLMNKKINYIHFIHVLKCILLTTLIAYLINYFWEFYIEKENIRKSFQFSFEKLRFIDLTFVIESIMKSILEKPYFLILIFINLIILIKFFYQDTNLSYYCIVSLVCNLLMIFFLIISYISVFGEFEGRRAASFERYIAPMGFISLIPLSIMINYKNKISKLKKNIMSTFSILLYLILLIVSKDKIIRNHDIDYKFIQDYIVKNLSQYKNVNIIDFYSYGYIGHLLKFRTHKIIEVRGYDPLNTQMNKEFLIKLKNKNDLTLVISKVNEKKFIKFANMENFSTKIIKKSKDKNFKILKLKYE